ncbi:MAG: T9SS type A sorting domain-containing protein [Ignavibacteria bacterium]
MKTKKYFLWLFVIFIVVFKADVYSQSFPYQCRHNLAVPIIDFTTSVDSMFISIPAGNRIIDVNLLIDTILHTWDSDLNIYLRNGNIGILVINNIGGSADNFIGSLLDDSAAGPPPPPPFTGTFRPHDSLSRFNNSTPGSGYWELAITDTAAGDTGILKAWCLRIIHTNVNGILQTIEIPNTYRLYQNYPNPFNPVTKIRYGVPKNGYVKITVYNELGELVKIVDEGYKTANSYEAVFDATNLPSGVYYYKLEADNFNDTKKMVIIK